MERSFRGGGFRSHEGNSTAPVTVGEELDVKIEAVGEKGDGIAKKNGFVLFVPNTKAGDNVKIRVTKVLRKVGFAEVVGQGSGSSSEEEQSQEASGSDGEAASEESSEEEYSGEDSEDFGEEEQG